MNIPQKIVKTYNTKVTWKCLFNIVYKRLKISHPKRKFQVNDYIGISKVQGVFGKKYLPNWSTEIFQVAKVQLTITSHNISIRRWHWKKCVGLYPGVLLVEKILKKKGDKVRVKRLGLSDKHNSWINRNNIA